MFSISRGTWNVNLVYSTCMHIWCWLVYTQTVRSDGREETVLGNLYDGDVQRES